MRRSSRAALSALAVTAVVGGTVAFKALDKTVDVVIDGKTETVSTYASNVQDVLRDADVNLSSHDEVTPSPQSAVADGGKINVTRGRIVDYTLDGAQNRQWVTALTVDEALNQLGIADNAKVSASRSQRIPLKGTSLEITTAKDVTIQVDGQTLSTSSTSGTVGSLLTEQGITLEQQDTATPGLDTALAPGMTVVVDRIRSSQVQETQAVDFQVVEQQDSSLAAGQQKTLTEGQKGEQVVTYTVVTTNGVETARQQDAVQVTKAPVDQVVAVGTKKSEAAPSTQSSPSTAAAPQSKSSAAAPAPAASGGGSSYGSTDTSSVDGLNWNALAKCESTNNPKAVNPSGKYFGLYQFSLATWASVGGSGNPTNASAEEQTYRAKLLMMRSGAGQWECGSHLYD